MNRLNLLNKTFNRLTVVSQAETQNNLTRWNCVCSCGKNVCVKGAQLVNGSVQSCGCYSLERRLAGKKEFEKNRKWNETPAYIKAIKFIGKIYNRLTITEILPSKNQATYVKCVCLCGNTHTCLLKCLKNGATKSCGCYNIEAIGNRRRTHGDSYSRLFSIWQKMISRCSNPNCKDYNRYGGRGIKVCEIWKRSYSVFKKWALAKGYTDFLQIDRRRNNGNYTPFNCRWVTSKVNGNNKSNNNRIEYNGETKTVAEWSDTLGIPSSTIFGRLQRKWAPVKALTTPIRKGRYNQYKNYIQNGNVSANN